MMERTGYRKMRSRGRELWILIIAVVFVAAVWMMVSGPAFAAEEETPQKSGALDVTVGEHGSVNGHAENYVETYTIGAEKTMVLEADSGYVIGSVIVNGEALDGEDLKEAAGHSAAELTIETPDDRMSLEVRFVSSEEVTEEITGESSPVSNDEADATAEEDEEVTDAAADEESEEDEDDPETESEDPESVAADAAEDVVSATEDAAGSAAAAVTQLIGETETDSEETGETVAADEDGAAGETGAADGTGVATEASDEETGAESEAADEETGAEADKTEESEETDGSTDETPVISGGTGGSTPETGDRFSTLSLLLLAASVTAPGVLACGRARKRREGRP